VPRTRTALPLSQEADYELTPLGATLLDAVQGLVTWTREHREDIAAARSAYDVPRV
jgi:DNA-binding HxlR family transcriptional regulator